MSDIALGSSSNAWRSILVLLGLLWLLLGAALLASGQSGSTDIRIEWATETELNTAGFNIYRAESEHGEFVQINQNLIPGEGSAVTGAEYIFLDENVPAGQTYYYQLEDIELDNSSERHPVIAYQAPQPTRWVFVAAGASILCGLALLRKGLRKENGH